MRIPDLSTVFRALPDNLSGAPLRRSLRDTALAALILLLVAACAGTVSKQPADIVMQQESPLVIGHRGASGYRPEHTLASYALAIEQGADVIEPDLVVTRDGVLICRHENEIGGTTDVAAHAEFAGRRTRKRVDGEDIEGWFAEDFTFAEIRTLRARERLPQLRSGNTRYDGEFVIPSFAEVIALAASAARPVAIYPETKHPTYFAHEGRYLDGTPIARSLGQMLVDELERTGFTDTQRVYVQSFELANLIELHDTILPAAGIELRLMQLFGDTDAVTPQNRDFALPYDLRWHQAQGDDLDALYPGLRAVLPGLGSGTVSYGELAAPGVLGWMRQHYAYGVAPWKDNLLQRQNAAGATPVRLSGAVHPLIAQAHAAGLKVHTYTLRAEPSFLATAQDGSSLSMEQEIGLLLAAGIDGFFTDFPDRGVAARDAHSTR